MEQYEFVKTINSDKLKKEIVAAALGQSLLYINSIPGTSCTIFFDAALSASDETTLNSLITAHVAITSVDQVEDALRVSIKPFIQNLLNQYTAENIANGITAAGKAGHVLAIFTKKYPIPNIDFQNDLKSSLDSGSLYIARDILIHVRANPTEFTDLSPFITDTRLLAMINSIESFLGIALSI